MKKFLKLSAAAVSSLMIASASYAETMNCVFTEPFIAVSIDSAAKTVTYVDQIEQKSAVYPILSESTTAGVTRVVWGPGEEENSVLEYSLDPRGGSDGMSERLYPYTGKTWTGDTPALVGGCSTKSNPPIDPELSPFPGCYEVLTGEFEDGSSYYKAIGRKIIRPLSRKAKTRGLAKFLEIGLITRGDMALTLNVCQTIDAAVR
jgi:uncharacterized membrane protein